MALSSCQRRALALLTGSPTNIFLTGHAGSGKSYLVEQFLRTRPRTQWPVVASTGAAAVLLGGRTFHSFFGLGVMEGGVDTTVARAGRDRRLRHRLRASTGVVLDEVSMIPGPALRAAEAICRHAREASAPWGGLRIIAVGDFAQLPPIARGEPRRPWAFLEACWERSAFQPLILREVIRSRDPVYLALLNQIREGILDATVRTYLHAHTDPDHYDLDTPHLFPHRHTTEAFNRQRLDDLPGTVATFPTIYTGTPPGIAHVTKHAPVPSALHLKPGALVMLRVNDPRHRFVNGSLATIDRLAPDRLTLTLNRTGKTILLPPQTFALCNADGDPIATARNFPVTLAYATTIHKAQGATLDRLVIDLRALWEPGQAYVALSRLRDGDGLTLLGWDERAIQVDPAVATFYRGLAERPNPPPARGENPRRRRSRGGAKASAMGT